MATRSQALATAARFGFVLDETNSGREPGGFTVIFDHPTHSIAGDCRSITCACFDGGPGTASQYAWTEADERMKVDGLWLEPCTDPECDYHHEVAVQS